MILIIISLIAGAASGAVVRKDAPRINMRLPLNTVTGLVGGGIVGQLFTLWLPGLTAAANSGKLDVDGIVVQALGGVLGGGILTSLVGFLKNQLT